MNSNSLLLRALRGPLTLILIGTLFVIDHSGGISFTKSWPIIVIFAGLIRLAEHALLSGQTPPRHEDNEATFEELRARIDTVLTYLAGFSASDFDGWETRLVPLPFLSGKGASAASYATEFALPNFYFHVSMVYGILRHSGVKLGKRAYIGGMQIVDL